MCMTNEMYENNSNGVQNLGKLTKDSIEKESASCWATLNKEVNVISLRAGAEFILHLVLC